jgi:hypothetical protein
LEEDFMAGFAFAPAGSPIVRKGSMLMLPRPVPGQPVVLPPSICIRCGRPADGKPVSKNYYWHHPAVYIALLSPIIYIILALALRKNMKVTVPLCAQHAQRRGIGVTLAWVLPLVGIADAIILPQFKVDGGVVALITIVLILAGAVTWAVVANPIRPRKIDQFYGEFTGFCETFLEQFPEGVPQPAVAQGQILPPPPMR